MSEVKQEPVHKVTLSTAKVVMMREMKIRYHENAAQIAGVNSGTNQLYASQVLQKEILKQLVVSVNGKPVPSTQLETLDEVFSYVEYLQLCEFLTMMTGANDLGKFQHELVSSGKT